MQKRSLCPTILVKLVLLTLVVLLPTFLAANILSLLKLGKHKHQPDNNRATAQTPPAMPLRMRRAESIPGHIGSGEPEGGPLAYEREKLANRAYPGTDTSLSR